MEDATDEPITCVPVLIVTGFLGACKATLLNRTLKDTGRRIAVLP